MGEEKNLDSRWRDFRRHPAVQAATVYIGVGGAWLSATRETQAEAGGDIPGSASRVRAPTRRITVSWAKHRSEAKRR